MDAITPRAHYSPHKRTRIVMWAEMGITHRKIARKEEVSPDSVHGIITRYEDQISAK